MVDSILEVVNTMTLGKIVRWSVTTAAAVYMGYANAPRINNMMREAKYASADAEPGFVEKDHAFGLKVVYQRNGKGNLETYLVSFNQRLPVQMRASGLVVGDGSYLWKSLTKEEREYGCSNGEVTGTEKKKEAQKRGMLERIFEVLTAKEE